MPPASVPITNAKWLTLGAAFLGYLLDAMDVLLYIFSIQPVAREFGLSNRDAGLVTSFTLVASSVGGILAGAVSDRIGRRRTLIVSILTYSLASGLSATSRHLADLLLWRTLVGFGLGGTWSAGAVLVAESWPAQHRAKAIGVMQSGWAIGYMAAAALSALVLPRWGWRVLFLIGVLPALVTVLIWRIVPEPAIWQSRPKPVPWSQLFRSPLASLTWRATAVSTAVMLGYWGLFSWLPAFLAAPVTAGGAGLSLVATSTWTFVLQGGALAGYLCFGWLADRIGRRPAFALYVTAAAIVVPLYGLWPRLLLGPLVGFFGSGYFSLFGAMLSELFPTSLRASGVGFAYNFGRAFGAASPVLVGSLADMQGFGAALAANSAFFILAGFLIFALPETRRAELA